MRFWLLMGLLAIVLIATVGTAAALAADKLTTLTGTVSVSEDDDWNITAVKITVDAKTVYQVVLDEKGKKLGNEMDGTKAEVTGVVTLKDGVKWIAVKTYKEIEEVDA